VKRRDFITLLGGAVAAWPYGARAQQAAMPIVGFVTGRSPEESARLGAEFRKGLNETGYVESQNVMVEYTCSLVRLQRAHLPLCQRVQALWDGRRRDRSRRGRSSARCDSLLWENEMIRDATDVKRRVMAQPLVLRNHKLLHGWFATALFLTGALVSSGVTAAIGEQFCTHGGQDPQKGDSVACYSDAGCRFAASLGAEPVRNFSPSSAPFALARGRITGIITSSSGLITQIKKVGGSCRRI
jgi:hypothetical protein